MTYMPYRSYRSYLFAAPNAQLQPLTRQARARERGQNVKGLEGLVHEVQVSERV